ncbi:hypothetical protein BpHYR1_024220 [Brachionus plicatilis]|uniref:Uncharacterized protein n=1 Tax=Brachionus plicatilis TaxID=10195 RepID=A0A3M7PDD7_BRAPC|nr:hypothetical protein BpHYR1_024220 [Brachionus plicatilis]
MITNIQGSKISSPEKPANFNYNTTIVALNPFKKDLFDDLHPEFSTSSRSSSGSDTNLAKLLNQRKYLINKNIRFYEPIKDAEIMAQMHWLRTKLQSTNLSKSRSKDCSFERGIKTPPISLKSKKEETKEANFLLKNEPPQDLKKENSEPSQKEKQEEILVRNNTFQIDDGEDFPGIKKFSHYRRKKNSDSRAQHHSFQIKPKRNTELPLQIKSSLPDISTNGNRVLSQSNFNYALRKSRKYRLNNIYKPIEHYNLVENSLRNKRSLEETNAKGNVESVNNINASSSVEFEPSLDKNEFKNNSGNKNNNLIDESYSNNQSYCQDPNCEYKNFFANHSLLHVKKEYPNERYQRIKNNEVKIIQNIISDIPNTLTTMSNFGKVTNFEKVLANKLSEFYTEKTRYVK